MQLATQKQINYLKKLGASESEIIGLNIAQASKLIKSYIKQPKTQKNYSESLTRLIEKQTELKSNFKEIVNDHEWYLKNLSFIGLLDDKLIVFDKKSIETRFCYGYGYCGVSTQEEINEAYNMADKTEQDKTIFLKENLDKYNDLINAIKEQKENNTTQSGWKYAYTKNYIYNYYTLNVVRDGYGNFTGDYIEINNYDLLIEILEYEKAKFEKRLNAYLKRYGLSKLKVWTYLID